MLMVIMTNLFLGVSLMMFIVVIPDHITAWTVMRAQVSARPNCLSAHLQLSSAGESLLLLPIDVTQLSI